MLLSHFTHWKLKLGKAKLGLDQNCQLLTSKSNILVIVSMLLTLHYTASFRVGTF